VTRIRRLQTRAQKHPCFWLCVVAAIGCASTQKAPVHPTSGDLDSTFARIQVDEAELDRARVAAANADAPCQPRCDQASAAQRHAGDLCAVAQQSQDRDALSRCDAAERMMASLDAELSARCACRGRP
jgi:hypothetical protein